MSQEQKDQLLTKLAQFIGGDQPYVHPTYQTAIYTAGVRYLATHARCYWLVEHILINQMHLDIQTEPFQVWKIMVDEEHRAKITVDDGNGNIIRSFKIPYTDFPFSEFTLWLENKVLMLPSER